MQRKGILNMINQPEYFGMDIHGVEVLTGDSIVLLPNGQIVQESDLEDYLIEHLGFQFITAK